MSPRNKKTTDLREACIQEALSIIEESGVEKLSMREVSRRLGVSHQAPYIHFQSRDHILAEVVSQAYKSFALYLDKKGHTGNPVSDLGEMGKAYLHYVKEHPLPYRLMFGTPLPPPEEHPEMMRLARHAYSLLQEALKEVYHFIPMPAGEVNLNALFIFSTLHGFSSLMQSHVIKTLGLPDETLQQAEQHILMCIGRALGKEGS